MIGRRLQPVNGRLPFDGDAKQWQPGDYCGPLTGYTGDMPAVFYRLPLPGCQQHLHHVCSPPHTFRECADGSLEIRNSILHKGYINDDVPDGQWHGYLDEGNKWRLG